jgi:flagellar biosynthesis/type III secretory pathway protein FliH
LSAEVLVKAARFLTFSAFVEEVAPPPPKKPALDEAAVAREAARREGLALGGQQGRHEALAEWSPRLNALAAALEDTLAAARAERERLAAELASLVPQIALTLAEKVIERELAATGGALRTIAGALARRVAESGVSALRVAPEVAAALEAWRGEDRPTALDGVAIRADASLRPGDWIIETDGGLLDGRLATQLEEAARILTEPAA